MKKVLALVLVVLMLAAMAPMAMAAGTVNFSVSLDGKLLVAAQPVSVSDMTVDGALKAAHKAYFKDGEAGYAAGIDATWNMFLITKCWGVAATPYVMINGAPLGSDPANPATADVAAVKAGDNIAIVLSSDAATTPKVVGLTATVAGGSATLTATEWVLDFTTFAYKSSALANAKVVDPTTGTSLGTTDASGKATVTVPASGLVAIDGLAAVKVGEAAAGATTTTALPQTDGVSVSTIIGIAGLGLLVIGAATIVLNKRRASKSV
jgi:LPXTG-motif cell wall-anchored protein